MARFDLGRVKDKAAQATDGFTRGQKAMMGLALGAVVVGMFMFTRNQGGQRMAALYSNLDAADASSIVEKLEAQGVSHELADEGSTVMVPSESVYDLRLSMQAEGLPAGGEGWSLIDEQGITASQFKQRVDFQRALSGELAKTIEAMDSVTTARVNLVVPSDDVFAADEQHASASVLVKPTTPEALSKENVRSIANLVASAVPELSTDAITITDTAGRSLWFPGKESIDASGSENASQQAAEEQRIAAKITEQLDKLVGPGKNQVTVAAAMNFDQTHQQTEQHSPPGGPGEPPLPSASSEETETFTGAGTPVAGPLGADGQTLVDADGTVADAGGQSYSRTSETAEWLTNRQVTDTVLAPGTLERLSISAVVDETAVSAADLENIRSIITNAAGLDVSRGDTLAVVRMPFDTTAADAAAGALAGETGDQGAGAREMARGIGVVALVLAALLLAWRSLRKRSQPVVETIDLRELEGVRTLDPDEEMLALGTGEEAWDLDEELPALDEPEPEDYMAHQLGMVEDSWNQLYEPPPSALAVEEMEAELGSLVDHQAEDVAMLLRSWLGDRREAVVR